MGKRDTHSNKTFFFFQLDPKGSCSSLMSMISSSTACNDLRGHPMHPLDHVVAQANEGPKYPHEKRRFPRGSLPYFKHLIKEGKKTGFLRHTGDI